MWNAILLFFKTSSYQRLFLIIGVLVLILSSLTLGNSVRISSPIFLRILGGSCLFVSILLEILYHRKKTITRLNIFEKNMCLRFGNMTISFKIEDIQLVADGSQRSSFVLPITTNLLDECITSQNCAAGAFIVKHHSQRLDKLKNILAEMATPKGTNYCDIESVLVLPDEFNTPSKIFLVVTSEYDKNRMTNPAIIFSSMRNILQNASNCEINHLYLPVIGSGHGSMGITEALNLLIICLLFLSYEFPENREITICIRQEDMPNIKSAFFYSFNYG